MAAISPGTVSAAESWPRSPAPAARMLEDLTLHLGVSEDDLRHAQQAEVTFHPYSLNAPLPGQQGTSILADSLGAEDPRQEHMLSMQAVAAHWGELPLREQEILLMRFRSGMTQTQIGQRLGISQMQVSGLIARALGS